jgi:hypothetical protein
VDVYGASNPQQINQLIFSCNNAKEQEVYFGLFSFFYDESLQTDQYELQQLAGTVLMSVMLASALDLDASVYAAAKCRISVLKSYLGIGVRYSENRL